MIALPGGMKMNKKIIIGILLVLSTSQYALAFRGGTAHYKYTKPYVTKQGQFRNGAIKDVSANGNKFDNANKLGLNGKIVSQSNSETSE